MRPAWSSSESPIRLAPWRKSWTTLLRTPRSELVEGSPKMSARASQIRSRARPFGWPLARALAAVAALAGVAGEGDIGGEDGRGVEEWEVRVWERRASWRGEGEGAGDGGEVGLTGSVTLTKDEGR